MHKNRLEAFTDGVMAIIITIMVLQLEPPKTTTLASLIPLIPIILSYLLSFIYVGIYWNNHHHLLHASNNVSGKVMWANHNLLFWLSLIPFATDWVNESLDQKWPVAIYGAVLFMAGLSYYILTRALINLHGNKSAIAQALKSTNKEKASIALYAAGIGLSFFNTTFSLAIYIAVAAMWFVPDSRIEKKR